ncbi:MAG: acyl-CoA dehydrogenase family protein, partial [Chloroflexota bacterium]|nr:acyl-CoA dehydrogenase family protein [Chloroflexota bacterium]
AGLDCTSAILIGEYVGGTGSFGVTLSVHSGIGTMPLALFGNSAQKKKYLPPLVNGEKIGAYALTEPKSGTDALSIETRARLSPDGKYYILDGTKQFITNGGIADIFFTYAKVDGDKMTAFVVERGFEGVSTGPEEGKLGIRGSSTTNLFLDSARVPARNIIFEIGRGHVVAFNTLNIGRFKVAAGCVGMAKQALEDCIAYARERVQFGRPICQFGLIQSKIAGMATDIYMAESMLYRTCGLIDGALSTIDRNAKDTGKQYAKSLSDYAIECSINKIYCSEMLARVTDEAVQIFGGYGCCDDYPAERLYRDCRIFRIYEGTNEINRVIIAGRLLKKVISGEIDTSSAAVLGDSTSVDAGPLGYQQSLLRKAKEMFLLAFDAAMAKYGDAMDEEQEIMGMISDMAIDIYAAESGLLRALKSIRNFGEQPSFAKICMVHLYMNASVFRIADCAQQILAAVAAGETLETKMEALREISRFTPADSIRARRIIAERAIEAKRFTC